MVTSFLVCQRAVIFLDLDVWGHYVAFADRELAHYELRIIDHKVNVHRHCRDCLHSLYEVRPECEKYFCQMKTQMGFDRQRNWSEEGKTGRLLILFVGLIISSYVRHIWKTTGLKKQFASTQDILDEMRSIRCIEHNGRAKFITPFVGAQKDICKAFGFDIPEGCGTEYKSRKVSPKRRGRPAKAKTVKLDS